MSRRRAVGAVVGACFALCGCGSSTATEPDAVEAESITEGVRAPSQSEITEDDLDRFKRGTASRSFVEFWSDLQSQDWVAATDRYSRGHQRVVGPRRILEALKYQAGLYRGAKPAIQAQSTRRGLATIRFSYTDPAGARRLSSTIWQQESGRWRLVFDGLLEGALRSWAQAKTQQITAPPALKPNREALKAGIEASERQGRYLRFVLRQRRAADGG